MEYKTQDISLAAYLLAKGKKMIRHDRDGHIVYFRFEGDPKDYEKMSYDYINYDKVPASKLFACREILINIIKGEKK